MLKLKVEEVFRDNKLIIVKVKDPKTGKQRWFTGSDYHKSFLRTLTNLGWLDCVRFIDGQLLFESDTSEFVKSIVIGTTILEMMRGR